jgi:hypothetical protein
MRNGRTSGGQGTGLDGDDAWVGTPFQGVRSGRIGAGIDTAFACGPYGERSLLEEGAQPRLLLGVEVRLLGRGAFPRRPLREEQADAEAIHSRRTLRRKVLPEEGALPRFLLGVEVRLLGRDAFPRRPLRKNKSLHRHCIRIRTFRRKVPA